MPTLNEVCELVWRKVVPNGSAQSDTKRDEIIATGQLQYASSMWIRSKELEASDGYFEIPAGLLTEKEFPVNDNMIDLTDEPVLNSLGSNGWLQDVGGVGCDCKYIKSSLNEEKILKGDDSIGNARTFFPVGKKIMFPRGTHNSKLKVTYVNNGSGLDADEIMIDEYVGAKVMDKLMQLYGPHIPADHSADSNSNTP